MPGFISDLRNGLLVDNHFHYCVFHGSVPGTACRKPFSTRTMGRGGRGAHPTRLPDNGFRPHSRRTGRGRLTAPHGGTSRPFTVVVCTSCQADNDLSVIDELRPAIRRCPSAMLVAAACMLGPITCASRPTGCGVMAVLQPCTNDRKPSGPPRWLGPITDHCQAAVLRDWLERGQWEDQAPPRQLSKHQRWAHNARQSN